MVETTRGERLLQCLVHIAARHALQREDVEAIVGSSAKHIKAFNMCDGRRTQGEIAKHAGLDGGNFSRAARRWLEMGVVFEVGAGSESLLLHAFPIRSSSVATTGTRRKPRRGKRARR